MVHPKKKLFRTNPVVLKISYPYVKILFLARFFLKTRRSSKNVTQSNSKQLKTSTFYPDSFPVARNFEIDRWTPNSLMWPVFEFIRSPGIYSYPACSLYFQVSKSNTFSPSCQCSGLRLLTDNRIFFLIMFDWDLKRQNEFSWVRASAIYCDCLTPFLKITELKAVKEFSVLYST